MSHEIGVAGEKFGEAARQQACSGAPVDQSKLRAAEGSQSPAGAHFDEYADSYDAALANTQAATGEDREYFARGRVEWLRRCLAELGYEPKTLLDFGCGIGTYAPLMLRILQCRSLLGIDISHGCIERANKINASQDIRFEVLSTFQPKAELDLAYCNGVFHHILPEQREMWLGVIYDSLRPGGILSFWENNPLNPGTRYCMRHCVFDADAITILPWEARALLRRTGFELVRHDFLFYFPRCLSFLRRLEPRLAKLPLGGQYQVLCRKRVAPTDGQVKH